VPLTAKKEERKNNRVRGRHKERISSGVGWVWGGGRSVSRIPLVVKQIGPTLRGNLKISEKCSDDWCWKTVCLTAELQSKRDIKVSEGRIKRACDQILKRGKNGGDQPAEGRVRKDAINCEPGARPR